MNMFQELNRSLREYQKFNESETTNDVVYKDEKVGTFKDSNGTFFDVFKGKDGNYYDGNGVKLSDEEVKQFITKETEDIETPTPEDLEEDSRNTINSKASELMGQIKDLEDGLSTVTDPEEKKAIEDEINSIKSDLAGLTEGEDDEEDDSDDEETEVEEPDVTEEVTDEVSTEVNPVEAKINEIKEVINSEDGIDIESLNTKLDELSSLVSEPSVEEVESTEEVIDDCDKVTDGENCIKDGEKCDETDDKPVEECDSELKECEVKAIRVLRVSPSSNSYLIETETNDGIRYVVGKNYNSKDKILDEAEEFDSKDKASNYFKSLLGNK